MKHQVLIFAAIILMSAGVSSGEWTASGEGTAMPDGYIPVMLSNGNLCMTADHLGGVPFPSERTRRCSLSTGIFIAGRRLLYNIYGHGSYRLTLSVDGKAFVKPDRWTQTLDPFTAKSVYAIL